MSIKKLQFSRAIGFTVILFWSSTLVYFSCQPENKEGKKEGLSDKKESVLKTRDMFLGEQNCMDCHQDQYHDWENSHHAFSMKPADSSTVLGDFENARFEKDGVTFTFFKKNNKYWVNTKGLEGDYVDFEILYTFGVTPLQQYLVALPGGKMQALETAWDAKKNKWYHLYDHLKLTHNEWVNWTGGAMNWNTMCAQCHSTYLEKNFDDNKNTFDTKWASINVSCEACHGPGKEHIEYVASEDYKNQPKVPGSHMVLTSSTSSKEQVSLCAPCHSRRGQLTKNYSHEGEYLDHFVPSTLTDGLYHADGQIQDEVYVYGSFVQSKMYHNNVKCTNCHDPHTTKIKFQDNNLCLQCHEPKYDTKDHHFHEEVSEGAKCVNCHMPGKYYMGNDLRRDHSLRIPRPDLSVEYGTPNACNQCHDDKSPEWAAKQVENWHGKERPYHFSEDLILGRRREPEYVANLLKMLSDTAQPVIARATALQYINDTPHPDGHNNVIPSLKDPEPFIRIHAVRSLNDLPVPEKISNLAPLLRDPVKAVRVAVADVLLDVPQDQIPGIYRQDLNKANDEFYEYLLANVDSRDGQFAFGQYYDRTNQAQNAEKYYLKALQSDSLYNMSRLNLGILYNRQGKNDQAVKMYQEVITIEPGYGPAYYSLGLLYAEMGQMDKTIDMLKKTIEVMPENLRAYYNLGLALQNQEKPQEAEKIYLDALKTDPYYWEIHNAIGILYYQQGKFQQAKYHIDLLAGQFPNNNDLRNFQSQINAAINSGPVQ
ncbi:MAG: tetratricopeptide repeat protein [Cyclobacteriaceae bacterium]